MKHKLNELRSLTFKYAANVDKFVLQDQQNGSWFIFRRKMGPAEE